MTSRRARLAARAEAGPLRLAAIAFVAGGIVAVTMLVLAVVSILWLDVSPR